MGDISIPQVLADLDGDYGCEAVRQKNNSGNVVTVLKKKDFIDWVFGILFNLESHPVTRQKTLEALNGIAEKICDADSGQFQALLDLYETSNKKIDFKEIKKALAESLSWEFPPAVFSKGERLPGYLTYVWKETHLKNIEKSICLEKYEVPLLPNAYCDTITDDNLKGFSLARQESLSKCPVRISFKADRRTEIRVELATIQISQENRVPLSETMDVEIDRLQNILAELGQAASQEKSKKFKETYISRLIESMKDGTHAIEIFVDSQGRFSDENLAGLSEALVEMQHALGVKFTTSLPAGIAEEYTDVEVRINEIYIEARIRHRERFPLADQVPADD